MHIKLVLCYCISHMPFNFFWSFLNLQKDKLLRQNLIFPTKLFAANTKRTIRKRICKNIFFLRIDFVIKFFFVWKQSRRYIIRIVTLHLQPFLSLPTAKGQLISEYFFLSSNQQTLCGFLTYTVTANVLTIKTTGMEIAGSLQGKSGWKSALSMEKGCKNWYPMIFP